MSNLIDSNVDLFVYLIEGIRFGTWKDRRLNWALFATNQCMIMQGINKLDKLFPGVKIAGQ